ncbi:hypothetical protein HG1285_14579 [Hydrogenivirga sp. 128-5-R1-1]|nr:hypothetical protein HG1285_14579 [Hydrogenivirga sp. 128-5-R1-1]
MRIFRHMKVRKNITLSEEADKFLKELAREMGKSQSKVIEELILREAKDREKEKRLRAFEEFMADIETYKGKTKLVFGEDITFQKAKEMMGVEKYL